MADRRKIIDSGQCIQQGGFARTAGSDNRDHQLAFKALGDGFNHMDSLAALLFKCATRKPQGCMVQFGIQAAQIIFKPFDAAHRS